VEKASTKPGEPTKLGSYEIVRKLARAAWRSCFLRGCQDPRALKSSSSSRKILPKYHGSQRFTQLFLDEAKLAASLNHANIVSVYDIGDHGGDPFFAMEYLHGQDVRTLLHRAWMHNAKMPLEHAIQVAAHVAAALQYAHEKRRADGGLLAWFTATCRRRTSSSATTVA